MKRIVYILLVLSLIFALISCESNPIFTSLTSLANQKYAMVKVSVSTYDDGVRLNSSYKITDSFVSYSVELLSSLSLDGEEEMIETKSGKAEVIDGELASIDGDGVELPEYSLLSGKFIFEESNFKDVSFTENSFCASIISLSDFLACDTEATLATVTLEFTAKKITKLDLSYMEKGATVNISYEFT